MGHSGSSGDLPSLIAALMMRTIEASQVREKTAPPSSSVRTPKLKTNVSHRKWYPSAGSGTCVQALDGIWSRLCSASLGAGAPCTTLMCGRS